MAVYGPVRHQKNIIWTSEASVHILPYMLILLSQNEQGISALDLQKHIFLSGSSSIKSTFPWMQRKLLQRGATV
jgi:hypothetical protein